MNRRYCRLRLVLPIATLWAVCAAISSAAPGTAAAENLLPNPSFESSVDGRPDGWISRAWSGAEQAQWSLATAGHSGGQCLSIRSEQGSDAAWTATVQVRPNTLYRLSGWIRTHNMHGAVGALLNIQNMQHVRTNRVTGTSDWTRVSTTFGTGQETQLEINCLYGGWGQATGQAWYDDVVLEGLADTSQGVQAMVRIDDQSSGVTPSRLIYGGFIEHFGDQIYGGLFEPDSPLSNEQGFREDVIDALKQLRLAIVRWPGGCFASGYHWKDGVGKQRRSGLDVVWGVEDPHTFGTDEFVQWCRQVGCEPYICTNAGNGTPEEMKQWVEYCNATSGQFAQARAANGHLQPLDVRYWSIGNENWGGHEIGAKTPQEWGPLVLRSAELMRGVDPNLKLLAAATPNREWTLPLLEKAGQQLNFVAIHEYWLPCWGENLTPDYLSCITLSEGPESTINRVIELLDESGCRGRVKIAFDEWNLRGWHHPGFPRKAASDEQDTGVASFIQARQKNAIASQYTMADALFSASFLNACLRHADDVGMANIAPIVNTRGPLYVHPHGLVKRTTYHVLDMYSNLLETTVIPTEVASIPLQHDGRSVPVLDALATRDPSGQKWRVVLINRHATSQLSCAVRMGDRLLRGRYRATLLSGDAPDAYNDVDRPDRVVPHSSELSFQSGHCELPPHSVTVLEVQ